MGSCFLTHLQFGQAKREHRDILCRLVLTKKGTKQLDFESVPWDNADLLTPPACNPSIVERNSFVEVWQESPLDDLGMRSNETIKGEPLTLVEKYAAQKWQ